MRMCSGIDADIVLKVSSKPANSAQCDGVLAGAFAYLVEDQTLRPVYGLVELCQINPNDFPGDLSTTVHEVLHALVLNSPHFLLCSRALCQSPQMAAPSRKLARPHSGSSNKTVYLGLRCR